MLLLCDYEGSPMHCGLLVYGEFLRAYTMNYVNDTVDIFVMKEYKVNSSWTLTHALPINVIQNDDFSPLCCTKSGDIVGADDPKVKKSCGSEINWQNVNPRASI